MNSPPKEPPRLIPCASGNNVFTDCLIAMHGDLFRITGHPQMDFTAEDIMRLVHYVLAKLPNRRADSPELSSGFIPSESSSGDAIVDEAIALLYSRSKLGQEKYGATLMRNDLTLIDWMRYAIEESLDRMLYMIRALKDLNKLYDDGR